MSAAERQWLVTAWKSGRTSLHQLKASQQFSAANWRAPAIPDLPTLRAPVNVVNVASRMAATLDTGLKSQRRQINSDLQSAFTFFTHRLPTAAAKLVGFCT
jgi:hypothetical protein